jgi:hypothetical protein
MSQRLALFLPTKHHLSRGIKPLQTGLRQDLHLRCVDCGFAAEGGPPDQARPR